MSHYKVKEARNESCSGTCLKNEIFFYVKNVIYVRCVWHKVSISMWTRMLFWYVVYGGTSCKHPWFGSPLEPTIGLKTNCFEPRHSIKKYRMTSVYVHVLENGVFFNVQNLINFRCVCWHKLQFAREQECYSDTWFMVVPVVNVPGLVHQ